VGEREAQKGTQKSAATPEREVGEREYEKNSRPSGEKRIVQSQETGEKGIANADKEEAASPPVLSSPTMPMSSSDAAIAAAAHRPPLQVPNTPAAFIDEDIAMFTDDSHMKATDRSGWAFAAFAVTEPIDALPGPKMLGNVVSECWGPVVLAMGVRPVMRNQHKKVWPKGDCIDGFVIGATKHPNNVRELTAATQAARHLDDNYWRPSGPKSAKVVFCVDSEHVYDHLQGSDTNSEDPMHAQLISHTKKAIRKLHNKGISIVITWVRGHAGHPDNEYVDGRAKLPIQGRGSFSNTGTHRGWHQELANELARQRDDDPRTRGSPKAARKPRRHSASCGRAHPGHDGQSRPGAS
jgi:ribonuclease HI